MFRTAELLVVGSEFFHRDKQDTNSFYLAEQLEARGVRVTMKRTVSDHLPTLAAAFRQAAERVDLVISTGGLGPTEDDRTRDAVAHAFEQGLTLRLEALEDIEERFRRRGREMTPNNERQAIIPERFSVLPNPNGTAPGFYQDRGDTVVLVLPGPPSEMSSMYATFCGMFDDRFPVRESSIVTQTLRVSGLGESDMDYRISDLYRDSEDPEVIINFSLEDLEIRLVSRRTVRAEAEDAVARLSQTIEARLEGHLFARDGARLNRVVVGSLAQSGCTVATAESVTGGMVSAALTAVPGAGEVTPGSVVVYCEDQKVHRLGVDRQAIEMHGVVSAEVARQMALGVKKLFDTDYGLSLTGYAGPDGGTSTEPIGTVYVGCATRRGVVVERLCLPGDREQVRRRAVQGALFLLWRTLTAADR